MRPEEKKQNMEELKMIQEAENKLENRMKLRSAKNISQQTIECIN